MFSTKFLVAAPLALAAGLALATPASAQRADGPRELRAEINQLDEDVERIADGRRFTNAELQQARTAVDRLEERYRQYGRDGFSRGELNELNDRIGNARQRIFAQARDNDRRNR